MKKILFFIPTLMHGGAERVMVNLVNNMDTSEFDITVLTIFDVGVNRQYLKKSIKYKSIFKNIFRGTTTIFKFVPAKLLYKLFIKNDYDIVVSYLEGPTAKILSGCPNKKTKKIAWIHIELNTNKQFRCGFKTMSEAIKTYRSFDRIICVSETVKSIFVRKAGFSDNVEVLYNTNDTDNIIARSKEKVEDIIIDSSSFNVISVGKIEHSKGYDRLIEVHERLLNEGLNHKIYILGVGSQEEQLNKTINAKQLDKTFVLVGFKENPYKYMKKADLYVCSSRKEGFSTAVTEALILGVPCVSTCCSGANELLGYNDEYGIVVDNSTEGIYIGLKQMLTKLTLYKHYKKQALSRGDKFSKEKTIYDTEKMLRDL